MKKREQMTKKQTEANSISQPKLLLPAPTVDGKLQARKKKRGKKRNDSW
jgi:hypothetical protein